MVLPTSSEVTNGFTRASPIHEGGLNGAFNIHGQFFSSFHSVEQFHRELDRDDPTLTGSGVRTPSSVSPSMGH
jgi:hypothetical protein